MVQTPPMTTDRGEENSLTTVEIGRMKDGVVLIAVLDANGDIMGSGSGFFVDERGWIVTNYHVIEGSSDLVIVMDDETVYEGSVSILGYDAEQDLALLDTSIDPPRVLQLADSDQVEIGEEVVAIGSPQALQNTISEGIVSAFRGDFIQTTSAISPGSSGGALFNRRGEVIGVTSAGILEGENLGFAIPINQYKSMPKNQRLAVTQLNQQSFTLTAPQNVRLIQESETAIDVDWDLVPGASYYRVYAKEGVDGSYVELLPDGGGVGFTDPPINYYDLTPGEQYTFKVIAVNGDQVSDYSQPVSLRLQGRSLMTDEQYSQYLMESASVFRLGTQRILFNDVSIEDDLVFFIFSYEDNLSGDFDAIFRNDKQAFEDFIVTHVDEAAQYFQRDLRSSVIFTHQMDEYPEAFSRNSFYNSSVNYSESRNEWDIFFPIVEIFVPVDDEYYYPEWEENYQ